MKTVCKEMRKRQKHFPFLKIFIKQFFETYPNCHNTLQCLVENIEKEVKEIKKSHKQKIKLLFETINDLYLHFCWEIHWKQNRLLKNYSNMGTTHSYQCSEIIKCFGKLLKFLVYLGIILCQGASNSLWINRVLQAINILPVNHEIIYDSLLQLRALKKKYRSSYMEILRHVLCSEIILNISEPVVYVKSLMLFRRLKNYIEDEVAKTSLVSTASRIKPPSNLASWLSSLKISIDVNKSIVDQFFKKNSKQVFQELYDVLIDSENSGSTNNKLDYKEEASLLMATVGVIDTLNKNANYNVKSFEKINIDVEHNQIKKVLHLSKFCNKKRNSKKKKVVTNQNINLVNTEINTKPKPQLMDTKAGNLNQNSWNSRSNSTKHKKSKKKKKPSTKNGVTDVTVSNNNNDTKCKETSKNKTSGSKSKKSKKKKKPIEIHNNVIPDNKKNDLSNLETHSDKVHSSNNDYSGWVNSKLHTEESSHVIDSSLLENNVMINEEKIKDDGNSAIKKVKVDLSASDDISQTDKERFYMCIEKSSNQIANKNYLSCKLPNLLANYENFSSAEKNETEKRDVSSCLLVESGGNVLVPDTCQNDFNSIVPFNLDSWVPSKDDLSVSNEGFLSSDSYQYDSLTDFKQTDMYQNYTSNNSSFSYYLNDCEISRDTLVSNDGSQISNKYPYVSLIDIRKNKKFNLYQNSDYSNSSFDDSVGIINDNELSQDTCISFGSQISDKYPYVSLFDIKKIRNMNLYQKSDRSNSCCDSSLVENINGSEISQDTCILNKESQMSDKNSNDSKKVDKIVHHYNDLNYDPILGNVNINEVTGVSNQNLDNSSCHDLYLFENRKDKSLNTQGENNGGNDNKDSELSPDETLVESKQVQKLSKSRTLLLKQDVVNTNLKEKMNSPKKRQRKKTNYNGRKKRKINYSCDNDKKENEQKEGKHCQELESSINNVNDNVYLNDLSTLPPNHEDIETQDNEKNSPSINIALNHSDSQELFQFQEHKTLHEESNILHHLNGKQSASHIFLAEEQPCITLPNENHQNVSTCSIETVIDEFIESELSKVHDSCNNLNSIGLSNNEAEKTHTGSIHSVGENAYSPLQTRSDLILSNSFNYKSNLNTPQQNNQNSMLSVSSSSTVEKRSIENDVAHSMLNLSVNENFQRNTLFSNPEQRKENENLVNNNLNSGTSTFVVDCNIINDFDSRNSSRAGTSVTGDTTTIKVILNLINAKPENSSNLNTNSSGNGFLATHNSSDGLHSSVVSGQGMNNSNFSFPMYRNNSYFSEPPFFSRTVNELDTPPDSESHFRTPYITGVKNVISSCSNNETNFILSSKSKGRSSTPKKLSRKRHQIASLHSSESVSELQFDLNSSFSTIPFVQRVQCEDVLNTLNVHRNENNPFVKDNQNKEAILRTVKDGTPTVKKGRYRNSRPSIYSDESEDNLSVSTMSLLSGEETDQSLIETTDHEISPKSPLNKENSSKVCSEENWELKPTDNSLIMSTDDKILSKTPQQRKNDATKIQTKKLFQEEKWALDTLTVEPFKGKESLFVKQSTAQKKKRQNKVVKTPKNPKTNIKHDYNLRLRPLLTAPTKLMSYVT